ncbi:hypothetical protein [Bradyrhizobium sp. Tv2a-2]|uniref:hypothetical protein n=1 Tax=Bradyrhizobium sp. Tv2a-2 TaxID=113395 RepID=UPI000465688E|nr:hypothetical protein [Bradyrhizobium sp. Tv2a-2]
MAEQRRFSGSHPALIAGVLAFACAVILILLIHDRWSRPDVKPAEVASTTTTGQAAHSAGAKVLPTDPKLSVEPTPAAPKPVQPANPE